MAETIIPVIAMLIITTIKHRNSILKIRNTTMSKQRLKQHKQTMSVLTAQIRQTIVIMTTKAQKVQVLLHWGTLLPPVQQRQTLLLLV